MGDVCTFNGLLSLQNSTTVQLSLNFKPGMLTFPYSAKVAPFYFIIAQVICFSLLESALTWRQCSMGAHGYFPSNNLFSKKLKSRSEKCNLRIILLFDISFWSNIGIWNITYILGKKHISTNLQFKSPLLEIGFPGSDLHGFSVLCISQQSWKKANYANVLDIIDA